MSTPARPAFLPGARPPAPGTAASRLPPTSYPRPIGVGGAGGPGAYAYPRSTIVRPNLLNPSSVARPLMATPAPVYKSYGFSQKRDAHLVNYNEDLNIEIKCV